MTSSPGPESLPAVQQKQLLDQYLTLFVKAHERATAYTKGVVTIGYASLFAVWGFSKALLPARATAAVGLLATISAATFVIWEVYTALTAAKRYAEWGAALSADTAEALRLVDEHQAKEHRYEARQARLQYLALRVTILSALAAAAILTWYNIAALFLPAE